MRLHFLQHVAFENPGNLLRWADDRRIRYTITELFREGAEWPLWEDGDVLIVMGGPMGVYEDEKYTWLRDEIRFIRNTIHAGHKVLGICLGSQLIAAALDKSVYPGPEKEIGFFPVSFSTTAQHNPLFAGFGASYTVFHWHGDTFDLPAGAVLLASSEACINQAFLLDEQVLGLQFHLEIGREEMDAMIMHGAAEIKESSRYIQTLETMQMHASLLDQHKKDLYRLLDDFLLTTGISRGN